MPARDRRRPFWSKWFWKDWDAKTKDLDPWEYTAYHRLLSYAATCSEDLCSIPDDDRRLARAAGFGIKRWRSVRDRVLAFFFLRGDLRYEHMRLREDAGRWLELVARNTGRVNRRLTPVAHKRAINGNHARSDSGVGVTESEESEASEASTNGKDSALELARRDAKAEWLEAFESDFYPTYPRKVKPDAARRAWLAVKPWNQETCDAIFSGLGRWSRYWSEHDTPRDKIMHPATFLNSGAWKGEAG